jgi:hypothetical protein
MASSKHPDLKGVVLSSAEPVFYDAKYTAEMVGRASINPRRLSQLLRILCCIVRSRLLR